MAIAFGLFAHIGHRESHALGNQSAKGNARCFTAGHIVKGFKSCVAHHGHGEKIHQSAADARIGDQLAAINIGRRRFAGGQNKGLICIEMYSLNFEQHPCCQACHFALVRKTCRNHEQGPSVAARLIGHLPVKINAWIENSDRSGPGADIAWKLYLCTLGEGYMVRIWC